MGLPVAHWFRYVVFNPAHLLLSAIIACSVFAVVPAQAKDYDLVILNGRVMDPESGLDELRNVGITDGKITNVSYELENTRAATPA
jgi:hypothetical protein